MIRRLLTWTALLLSPALSAFVIETGSVGLPIRWSLLPPFDTDNISTNVVNPNTRAVRFQLGSDGWSVANRTNELNAIRAAFAQWQAVSGTLLKFEEGNLAGSNPDINTFDNTNVVYFCKSPFVNGGRDYLAGAAGRAYISWFTDNNQLAEADIVLNGVEVSWFTDYFNTNTLANFAESVALHEIGHFIGLMHTPVGAGTLFHAGDEGSSTLQTGLSEDDIAGVRALYAQSSTAASFGHVRGLITLNGSPVNGAAVFVEDLAGNINSGTVTRTDGRYELPYLAPGAHRVRVAPLDLNNTTTYLTRGQDISTYFTSNPPNTNFQPTTNRPVTLVNGVTNVADFSVVGGAPAFRISHLRKPTTNASFTALNNGPFAIRRGQSNLIVGVLSPSLPSSGATLSVTGDGVTPGATTFSSSFPGTNMISLVLNVASNATPGLRSLLVTRTSDGATAWANGFLEILPDAPDVNFDGLDDTFQRRWFSLFTDAVAGPTADPDNDGYTNLQEYYGQSNPTLAASIPSISITQITSTPTQTALDVRTVPGKRYQLQYRANLRDGVWTSLGTAILANGSSTSLIDAPPTNQSRFYRIQLAP